MEDFNDSVDGKLASKMRKIYPEQFHTLVKMHLSFELDLNTEDDCITEKAKLKKWGLLNFSKKQKSAVNLKGEEGVPLTSEGIDQVKQLVEYLSKEQCINQEGIFRRTGLLTRQQDLKAALYGSLPLNLEDGRFSVHDCASVLKGFLADLSEPLLTDLHYPAHCQIADLCSVDGTDARLLHSLQLLLLLLPPPNRILMKHILDLLHKTAAFEHSNKMNSDSLATLFTPHLLCPRKLSPEALHINSQNLSGLVSFMIKKGKELFEIPPKLSTDIRAYWVEQEKKLLSPEKCDLNESTSDTAHTVFSFVDHKLTAKATATEDTQAALAQLYAHIQSMPESAKKRRLVKQFNKENGQGTPRHMKNCRTKSLGDSIKKHIFQKKLLGHKKLMDVKFNCNFSRSNSEENILSATFDNSLNPQKAAFSKSDDELNTDRYEVLERENLLNVKKISSSTGSIDTPTSGNYKMLKKVVLKSFLHINESNYETSPHASDNEVEKKKSLKNCTSTDRISVDSVRYSRHLSEPLDVYTTPTGIKDCKQDLVRHLSDSVFSMSRRSDNVSSVCNQTNSIEQEAKSSTNLNNRYSPSVKPKLRNGYTAHTSTPSSLSKKCLAPNEYMLTPKTDDRSMSPITQSATKMSKAMQETMMTPRSRKPVMMISGSNICDLAALKNDAIRYTAMGSRRNVYEETPKAAFYNSCMSADNVMQNKENINRIHPMQDVPEEKSWNTSLEDNYPSIVQKSTIMSMTSTLKEYLLSRSVLTASPVDLSFTSRTGDFEQSESDLNVLNEDKHAEDVLSTNDNDNEESDRTKLTSDSMNSANDSMENTDDVIPSLRKRATKLQRNDSKRLVKSEATCNDFQSNQMHLSASTLNSSQDIVQETSF